MKTTQSPAHPARPERGAWDTVRGGWRQVYGSFDRLGVSIEWHDFTSDTPLDWGRSFHPGGIELCLNAAGTARVTGASDVLEFCPASAGVYIDAGGQLTAERPARTPHRFLTVEFRRDFLRQQFATREAILDPALRAALSDDTRTFAGPARALNSHQLATVEQLAAPPVPAAALPLWYEGKVCTLLAEFFTAPEPELFCSRQQRLARDRVERVQAILRARLEEPPTLEELGRDVGVSQFYLSRIFSQEMRMTIPQFLRRLRMERAAELLAGGRHNVTEAAFAVGYSSLGHFSKSFCEVMGCCPTLYPVARHLARR